MKTCKTCGKTKELTEFSKSREQYRSSCKACRVAQHNEKYKSAPKKEYPNKEIFRAACWVNGVGFNSTEIWFFVNMQHRVKQDAKFVPVDCFEINLTKEEALIFKKKIQFNWGIRSLR